MCVRAHVCVCVCVCVCVKEYNSKLRVSDQNGVSLLHTMLEIHHSGPEPLKCNFTFCSGSLTKVQVVDPR